jgi:steroid 5-alpha reductase family enzyme
LQLFLPFIDLETKNTFMLRTIIILIITLIALPFVAFRFDEPLSPEHWAALNTGFYIALAVALSCFTISELSRNYSQVDKIWSVVPIVYAWFFAAQGDWHPRLILMAFLVTVWAVRLTYNFSRRGAYVWPFWKGEEDYRWGELRKLPMFAGKPWNFRLFNLFFISLYQNGLIYLFTLPILAAWQGNDQALGAADYLLALVFLALVVMEYVADQQQWDFQTEKYRRIKAGEPLEGEYAQGFRSSGLWGLMRHPNYTAEQAIWVCYYFFSVAATGRWVNWSMAGAVLLILLFLGSSDFSEKISASRYPAYADYQRRVPRFLPRLFGRKQTSSELG